MSKWDSSITEGDTSEAYWSLGRGIAVRNGWTCRECRGPIFKGEPIVSRDGRKNASLEKQTHAHKPALQRVKAGFHRVVSRKRYSPDVSAEQEASRQGSRVVSRQGSVASSKDSSAAVSRGEGRSGHDRGSSMAGNVVKMAAMRLEKVAEMQGGAGDDDKDESKT